MRIISARIAHKLRAHACRWSYLPLTSVPSAAVTDEDTQTWSRESYDRDLANEPQQRTGWWPM